MVDVSNMSGVPGFATHDETWIVELGDTDRFFVNIGEFGDIYQARKFTLGEIGALFPFIANTQHFHVWAFEDIRNEFLP